MLKGEDDILSPVCLKCFGPHIFRKSNSFLATLTACAASHVPDFNFIFDEETEGSFEWERSRCPLIFDDFSTDVKLFIGNRHGEEAE